MRRRDATLGPESRSGINADSRLLALDDEQALAHDDDDDERCDDILYWFVGEVTE